MDIAGSLKRQLHIHRRFAVQFLSFLVAANGLYVLALTLLEQIQAHHSSRLTDIVIDVPLLVGLSLLYLGTLLRRQKRTAWFVTVLAYAFYLGLGVSALLSSITAHTLSVHEAVRLLLLPLIVLILLFVFQKEFVVRSDIQGFRFAVRFVVIILVATLIYGIAGFLLLDESDFHQEFGFPTALHYTVDQFDLTTTHPLHPYTKRARLFTDSLSFVSGAALIYVAVSLFQPLRATFSPQNHEREHMLRLLRKYGGESEEFFKLWPHDKQYFFDDSGESAMAFRTHRGVALCLGDPIGDPKRFPALISSFKKLCFSNDWVPALIHVSGTYRPLYEKNGFVLQKLGEEAVLHLDHFHQELVGNKYFRQIRNKFEKQDFSSELLVPPHHQAVLDRLHSVSNEWLSHGGRAERGFAMGYYTNEYIQQCSVMVVRDAAGTIQAFANLVPADFDQKEATYDMLRRSTKSLGNINDFLLMELIEILARQGYERLNLGLSPLVGLDDIEKSQRNIIDNLLHFAYANGDRFYSFSGLQRFKGKYEPEWQDRYVAYQDGMRNFSKTMASLMGAMRVKVKR